MTFKAALLNTVQEEYEALPKDLESMDLQSENKKWKDRSIANMKFIGHLFLRHLLSVKVVSSVFQDLLPTEAAHETPHEHKVECVIELVETIGHTLESLPPGQQALAQVCGRLMELKKSKNGKDALSKRIQFRIQDVFDMRSAGWTKKVFKGRAKTKEDIRLEHEQGPEGAERIVAGARPDYVDNVL